MKTIEVVAAIIQYNNETLCVQRGGDATYPYARYKYEFPGGKVEQGESNEQSLLREIKEELDLVIENPQFFMTVEHSYPDFHLVMHCYTCTVEHQDITLVEHFDAQWLPVERLMELDWVAADVSVVEKLLKEKKV